MTNTMTNTKKHNYWKIDALAIFLLCISIFLIFLKVINFSDKTSIDRDIFSAVNYEFSAASKATSDKLFEMAKTNGFMVPYRKVYKMTFSRKETDFEKKLAYISAIVKIGILDQTTKSHRNSALRLLIHFCRLNLIEVDPAIKLTKLFKQNGILGNDKTITDLWNNYLRLIFAKRLATKLKQDKKLNDKAKALIAVLPELEIKAKTLIAPKTKHIKVSYKYVLKENATGENESDYVQKEVKTEVFW